MTETIRNAKCNYEKSSFANCKNDIKGTWKLINRLILDKKVSNSVSSVNVGGSVTSDPRTVAQGFNDYFSSIASLLDSNIPHSVSDPTVNIDVNLTNSLFLNPVTPYEIIDIVRSLKNCTYGLYHVNTKMFKLVTPFLCQHMSFLINQSFSSCIFPDILKKAIVVPIHKSGDESVIGNY